MQLFYNKSLTVNDKLLTFDKVESRHIVKVLRKKEGVILNITNGRGLLFKGEIIDANEKHCTVSLIAIEKQEKEHPYKLHIAIAPTKLNDRFEWFLEKVTEIGIDQITPLLCDHSERKVIKPERLEKVIVTAAKQSLHFNFPVLNKLTSFKDFIYQENKALKLIAHCEEGVKVLLKNTVKPKQNICILIGPEGDFSSSEIKEALKNDFKPVSLGNSRLRTETAGVVACHSVAFINE
ncbi:MAG: 16S rRNA (uracil(1498)-N(3))-methyltransferase [Flavobacteriaceae bacterium]